MKKTFILISALLLMPLCAAAQPGVEVNLDVLEGYSPPPMFDDQPEEPVLTPGPEDNYYAGSASTGLPSITTVPIPPKKPAHSTNPLIIDPKPSIKTAKKTPPLPPKRPQKFHASESFVKEARENLKAETISKPPPSEPKRVTPESAAPDGDYLGDQLKNQSAQDILNQIDPDKVEVTKVQNMSLGYLPGVSDLTAAIKTSLESQLVPLIKKAPETRIEIRAFASVTDLGESGARRVSLARALEIRQFLLDNNVKTENIDIRPLGSQTDKNPKDRVDIYLINNL